MIKKKKMTKAELLEIDEKKKEFQKLQERILNIGNASSVGYRKGE